MAGAARVTRLPNGVTIVTEAMPSVASASLGVYVGAGARAETAREHGLAHLLEHMAFKGTARRSARQIVEEIESVGGDINAATSMEQTAYYARVLAPDVPLGLDILADIVTRSALDPDEIAREQAVIRQEIAAVQDTPDDLVFEHLQAAAFPDHPLGRSILGTEASVSALGREDLAGFVARCYVGRRMVVAAAGDVDHDALAARAAELFGRSPAGEPGVLAPPRFVGGELKDEADLEQVNVALALPGVAAGDPAYYAARVFAGALGGGMSSRLFQELREKRGLCYAVSAFHWAYGDVGLHGMHAGAAPEDVAALVPLMLGEFAGAAEGLERAEVERAKAQLKASLLMSLESSSARADRLARQILLFGDVKPVAEIAAAIDAVGVDEVRAAGRAALAAGAVALAAVGPADGLASAVAIANTGR